MASVYPSAINVYYNGREGHTHIHPHMHRSMHICMHTYIGYIYMIHTQIPIHRLKMTNPLVILNKIHNDEKL